MLQKWIRNGNPNCSGYLALLSAEKAALHSKDSRVVVELYQKAIVLNGRSGNVQDQALAAERLAGYHLEQSNIMDAKIQLEEAKVLYAEWGANAKVEQLMARISSLGVLDQ